MRLAATGMLAFMAVAFVATKQMLGVHPAWGYAHAFAEAALVGGLADWFAVTALFRHPLGIPIPHTAIIPENKDRIADTMAQFLRENFLVPAVVARRMAAMNVAGAAGEFLAAPTGETRSRITGGAAELLAEVLESLDPARLGTQVRGGLAAQLAKLEIAPLLGRMLENAIADRSHLPLMDGLIRWSGLTLEDNEDTVREIIRSRANAVLRWTGLDERLSASVLDGLYRLLAEVLVDREHPLRHKMEEGLETLARDLQHDPKTREKIESLKREMLENPALADWWMGVWERIRRSLIRRARDPGKRAGRRIAHHAGRTGQRAKRRCAPAEPGQPLRPPHRRGRRNPLWRPDRAARVGNRSPLGCPHPDRPRRRRGRPRPAIHPHQRHAGRRAGRDDAAFREGVDLRRSYRPMLNRTALRQ